MNSKTILTKVAVIVNNSLIKELHDQGHYLTGALERSITSTSAVVEKSNEANLIGFALAYADDLETGQSASGKLPTVAELVKYFLLRGLPRSEAMVAAVNTAKRHKKEGMPTEASKRFSKTGERKHFITRAWVENEQKVDSYVSFGMDTMFDDEFTKQKSEII